jgi:hypothetical protein
MCFELEQSEITSVCVPMYSPVSYWVAECPATQHFAQICVKMEQSEVHPHRLHRSASGGVTITA